MKTTTTLTDEPSLEEITAPGVCVEADGSAVFSGDLSAATGTIGTLDIADDLFLATSHDIRWGTQASPTTITKSLLLSPQSFVPDDEGTAFRSTLIYYGTNDFSESISFAALPLPTGVTISGIHARVFANDVSQDTTEIALYRADRTAQTNSRISAFLTPSSDATWQTKSDTSLSETVSGDAYVVRFRGDAASATTACRVAWVEVDYDVANLRQSL